MKRITDEAKQWGWSKDIIDTMKAIKTEELLGKQDITAKAEAGDSRNAAVEAGTMAYYEAQMKANQPMLDESKKSNRHLAGIERAVNRPDFGRNQSFTVIG